MDEVREPSRLGVLEAPGSRDSLTQLLAVSDRSESPFRIETIEDVSSLLRRAAGNEFAAIVVAPELSEGWPTSVAADVIDAIAGRLPLIFVCRSPQDAELIANRGGREVVVLVRQRIVGAELVGVVEGELTRHRISAGSHRAHP
jgi:hypothetical protein